MTSLMSRSAISGGTRRAKLRRLATSVLMRRAEVGGFVGEGLLLFGQAAFAGQHFGIAEDPG